MAQRYAITSWATKASARLRARDGFTLIELLVAITVLTVGILSLTTVLASSNKASGVSETQQAEINRAQKEIERIQSLPYSQIAMTSAPSNVTNIRDPNYYVTSSGGSCPSYQWNQSTGQVQGASNTDALVINGCNGVSGGTITTGAQAWSDSGGHSGNLYDYVTWVTDTKCAPGCPASNDFKRVTVAITNGQGAPYAPVLISATIADPHANGGTNPVGTPSVTCTNSSGQTVSCTLGLGSNTSVTFHLTDCVANASCATSPSPPSIDHVTHPTVGPLNILNCIGLSLLSGCPVPDFLGSSPPTGTAPVNYSTDQGSTSNGRIIQPDVACGGTPTTSDNTKGEYWVTPQRSAAQTLTGNGGMTLFTKTANGQAASVTMCVAVYDVPPNSFLNLLSVPPIKLGVVAYTLAAWPTTLTPISFTFNFLGSGTAVIPTGDRIGVRIWVASGGVPIQTMYDGASVDSQVQLITQ